MKARTALLALGLAAFTTGGAMAAAPHPDDRLAPPLAWSGPWSHETTSAESHSITVGRSEVMQRDSENIRLSAPNSPRYPVDSPGDAEFSVFEAPTAPASRPER